MEGKTCKTCGRHKSICFCRELYEKDWRRTNPSKHRLYNDRKRAQTPNLTAEQKQEILQIYDTARAMTEATGEPHHVDHIKPISKGGLHVPENLQILTWRDNLAKKDKWEGEQEPVQQQEAIDLTDEQILSLCQSLANRYRRSEMYDDLVSEGLVACYECRAEGKSYKKDYVGAARRAMNDFINIKSKAMSIPKSWTSRAVSHALATGEDMEKLEGVNEGTFSLLLAAMRNDASSVDEGMSTTEGAEVDFEEHEFHVYLLNKVKEVLDDDDWEFLLMISDEDTTQQQVADILDISHQAVSLRLRKIQSKARRFVTKSDLSDL